MNHHDIQLGLTHDWLSACIYHNHYCDICSKCARFQMSVSGIFWLHFWIVGESMHHISSYIVDG